MINPKIIGKRLKTLRGDKEIENVTDAIGISPSALYMYERGERVPRDEIKIKLAEYYGVTVEKIFFTV